MISPQQVAYIEFQGKQVALHSNDPEILMALLRRYDAMVVPEPVCLVAKLEVHREEQTYYLQGTDGLAGETTSFSSFVDAVDELSYAISLCFIRAHSTLLWFHAGVAACQGRAVILAGTWGQGKSTLVTSLVAQGWTYLSDELAPLDPVSGKVFPFPRMPMVRESRRHNLPRHRVQGLKKRFILLQSTIICREAMPIGTLILPRYSFDGPNALSHCSPATATIELLRNCLNFTDHTGDAVRYLCGLVQQVPAFQLRYHQEQQAAKLIMQTQQTDSEDMPSHDNTPL